MLNIFLIYIIYQLSSTSERHITFFIFDFKTFLSFFINLYLK